MNHPRRQLVTCVAQILLVSISGLQSAIANEQLNPPTRKVMIRVAAASDLRFVLDEMISEFQKAHPGITVQPIYGASGNLFAQLSNGAPFDLFLSADIQYPRKLIEAGKADASSDFNYATGHLVLWTSKGSNLRIEERGIDVLLDPSIEKVAIANPVHAPYGRAAEAALRKLKVYDRVRPRLVLGDSVVQTAQFVESGAADIGVIAKSLALSPLMREKGRFWEIPKDAYPALQQGGVIISTSKAKDAVGRFRAWMLGKEGRELFTRFGFGLPGD